MKNTVIEFIKRRFPVDCNWLNGNCFFFAQILKSRFPYGIIFYDVIYGHFVTEIEGIKYDWSGIVKEKRDSMYIKWDDFDNYDSLQKKRIIDGCIK